MFDRFTSRFRSKKPVYPVVTPEEQLESDLLNVLIHYDPKLQLQALKKIVKKQFPLTWRVYRVHIIRNRKQESMVA